jgi:hypothetical protein
MNKITITMLLFFGILASCKDNTVTKEQAFYTASASEVAKELPKGRAFTPSDNFKAYWYAGEAEISSYKLEQARYGELRDGAAVLVFVTEDFLPKQQVKADDYNKINTPVLKLNATKNFNTGVYPYSIMQSTFYPISNNDHALKVSCSVQEWCGHVYTQLNQRDQFEIMSHSYFESEGDQDFKLDQAILENELWTQLRLDPKSLPTGSLDIIPSLEFVRLKHIELKAYKATATIDNDTYTISYPHLGRELIINFDPEFPYNISSWEDTFKDGYGTNAKTLTTKATLLKTIKSPYWSKNSKADKSLRETLLLDEH